MNVDPAEYQTTVDGHTGALRGAQFMHFYAVPGADSIGLPADPAACATDPGSCLPATAPECDPSAGCDPRIVIIGHNGWQRSDCRRLRPRNRGVCRLDQGRRDHAGPAVARLRYRPADPGRGSADLIAQADAAGVPLSTLLGTKVRLRLSNGPKAAPSSRSACSRVSRSSRTRPPGRLV